MTTRQAVKVQFASGNSIVTDINGTKSEIRDYYLIGSQFNLGDGQGGDFMDTVTSVEFLTTKGE